MNQPTSILVVDDHLHLAENIAEILDGEGYHALVAARSKPTAAIAR
jgi:CheY-like chemotaxis protein